MKLPPFILGIDYFELRGGNHRFESLRDIHLVLPALRYNVTDISFRDAHGREWARVTGCQIIIRSGYRWNGATPKWWVPILNKWAGVPDPEPTRLATMFHDVAFQFLRTAHWPLPVSECNAIFRDIMVANKFRFAHTYHGAVTDFGFLFTRKYPKHGEYSILL